MFLFEGKISYIPVLNSWQLLTLCWMCVYIGGVQRCHYEYLYQYLFNQQNDLICIQTEDQGLGVGYAGSQIGQMLCRLT